MYERIKTLKLTCRVGLSRRLVGSTCHAVVFNEVGSPKGVAPSLKGVMLTHLKAERGGGGQVQLVNNVPYITLKEKMENFIRVRLIQSDRQNQNAYLLLAVCHQFPYSLPRSRHH